ncbi:hypothetical protein FCIRC_8337 [Fusarium circinatum]|uniref:Uncharacterized protein n=1 Tax=Fusarium circinatum TaxID=48490 RepID=A0A8H5WWH9_FUSCI|nr:hypothetical protein FCIRC_8337 [Fusarium circinatum]
MAPSCLSKLLVVLLVGATHVVAHPLNMDGPSPVIVARTPCTTGRCYKNKYKNQYNKGNVTWKTVIEEMYENENKYKHGDHDDKEPTDEAYKDAWKDALEKYKNEQKNKDKHGNQDDEESTDEAYSHKNKNKHGDHDDEEPSDKTRKDKYKDKHGNHDDKEPTDGAYKDKYKDAWKDTWEKFKNEQKNKYKHHDDKYASKYRPEENGVKESTKTEYPEEVSSKDDKKTETTHKGKKYNFSENKNSKDDQEYLKDSAQNSKKHEIDEDSESQVGSTVQSSVKNPKNGKRSDKLKARQVLKNNRDGKSKHGQGSKYPGRKGKKKKTSKSDGRTLSLIDVLTGGKGRLLFKLIENKKKKPKFRPPGPIVPFPGFSAKLHNNGLAPTEEKGIEKKAKISRRCLPFWAWLLIGDKIGRNREAKKKNKQIKELEEAKKKHWRPNGKLKLPVLAPTWATDPQGQKVQLKEIFRNVQKEKQKKRPSKLIPNVDGKTSKAPVKKPIKEKGNVKEKVSAASGKESDSSETKQKKTKENKQM